MVAINSWEWFIKQFHKMSHIDLNAYKRPQMERRINSFISSVDGIDYRSFIDLLKNDKQIYHKFIEHLTINVSEFFRNSNSWRIMEKEIIPLLYQSNNKLRVWSAGCSTGEEPYSLAMLFKERFNNKIDKILATDLDQEVLKKAVTGLYLEKSIQDMPESYFRRYFQKNGDYYKVSDDIQKMVTFKKHDLLKDPFPHKYDLILCRNVVIYFTEETKQKLYEKFAKALNLGGVIFIGGTEQIFRPAELGFKPLATFFYQKVN